MKKCWLVLLIYLIVVFITPVKIIAQPKGDKPPSLNGKCKITGQILTKEDHAPLQYANVALTEKNDSVPIAGCITNTSGEFVLKKIPKGNYTLCVKFIGYGDYSQKGLNVDSKNVKLKPIELQHEEYVLKSVEVNSKQATIEQEADRRVMNITNQLSGQYTTAAELMRKMPGVTPTIDGNIIIRGSKDFLVLIDERPTLMNPQQALQSIPSSRIKRIELITTPGAQYSPEGTSGIVNIITKKQLFDNALSGQLALKATTRDRKESSLNVVFNKNKSNWYTGYSLIYNPLNIDVAQEYTTPQISPVYQAKKRRPTLQTGWLGVGFKLADKLYLDAAVELGSSSFKNKVRTTQDQALTKVNNYAYNDMINSKLELTKLTKTRGEKISLFAQYKVLDGFNNRDYAATPSDVNFNHHESGNIETKSLQFDYKFMLNKKSALEIGCGTTHIDREKSYVTTDDNVFNFSSHGATFNVEREEWNGRATYKRLFGRKMLKVGLRAEQYKRVNDVPNVLQNTYEKLHWYPSAHLSYPVDKTLRFQGGYSRRIERVRNYDLDPYSYRLDGINVKQGNTQLVPSMIDSYEITASKRFKKMNLSGELFHRVTHDAITPWIIAENNQYFHEKVNANNLSITGTTINFTRYFMKRKLELFSTVNLFYKKQDAYMESKKISQLYPTYQVGLYYEPNKKTTFQVQLDGKGRENHLQGYVKARAAVNFAATRWLFKKKLQATLNIMDMLNSWSDVYVYSTANQNYQIDTNTHSRYLYLALRYNFNNFKRKRSRVHTRKTNNEDTL